MSKGRLLQFRSPGHLLNRSLPLVGLTPIYSSFMSYRYVGSKVSLNRETLLTMGATEGCEWFILFSLPSLPYLTFQPEVWHSVTLCSLFVSNILFKKFTQFVCVAHNQVITALLFNVYGNFKSYISYIINTLLVWK